jgi:integrase
MADIKALFKAIRPDLSEGSLKTYASTIGSLFKSMYPTDSLTHTTITKLNKDKTVLDFLLANKSEVGRKPVLSALVVLFDNDNYRKQMLMDAKAIKKEVGKQEMSETTEENWVSQDEITNVLKGLKREADAIYKSKDFSNANLQQIQLYIILALLGSQYIPPRRAKDYTDFKVKNISKETDNFIEKNEMVFNSFKTAKFGQQRVPLPKELKSILTKWIKINPTEYLLFDINGNQLSSPQLNQRLNKIFGSTSGKSVNMMRHSFLTEKYGDGIIKKKELVADMTAMGSSLAEAPFYIEERKGHNGPKGPP